MRDVNQKFSLVLRKINKKHLQILLSKNVNASSFHEMPWVGTLLHSQGNPVKLHLRVNHRPLKSGDDAKPYMFCFVATDTGQQLLEEGRMARVAKGSDVVHCNSYIYQLVCQSTQVEHNEANSQLKYRDFIHCQLWIRQSV